MKVHELAKQLLDLPWDAEIGVALPGEDIHPIGLVGCIPEGPLGIYKPNLCYIEFLEFYEEE